MKTCYKCKENKEDTEFNKNQSACRPCGREISRAYYKNNAERLKKQMREKNKINRDILRAEVKEIKNQPCADCGVSYPTYVMDFDHREGVEKLGLVSHMVSQCNRTAVYIEIEKCDVVCSNCHRIRTHERGYHYLKNQE